MPDVSLTKTDISDRILSKIVMKGMRMKDFFGRDELIESLKSLWSKRVPSLVTCRGRRRVGKSTLVAEFARRAAGIPSTSRGRTAKSSSSRSRAVTRKGMSSSSHRQQAVFSHGRPTGKIL